MVFISKARCKNSHAQEHEMQSLIRLPNKEAVIHVTVDNIFLQR